MTNKFIRDVKEVIRRLRNRGISFDGNRQYPAIPTIDNSVESHTNALRAIREAIETHERRNSKASLDSFVRLYELEDVLGGFEGGDTGAFAVDNVGTGAKVHKITESVGGVPTAKLRSIKSSDGSIAVAQLSDEIDLTVAGGGLVGYSDTALAGTSLEQCSVRVGATPVTMTYTPAVDTPGVQVNDLAVMVIYYQGGYTGGNGSTTITGLTGWTQLVGPGAHYFAVYYKILTDVDLTDTWTFTLDHALINKGCRDVYVYRNVNTEVPFYSFTSDAYMYGLPGQASETKGESGFASPSAAFSTGQHALSLVHIRDYTNSYASWDALPQLDIGEVTPEAVTQHTFPYLGGDTPAMHFRILTRKANVSKDENLIPGETIYASVQDASWTTSGISVTRPDTYYTALNTAGAGSIQHYAEQSITLAAGEKVTFFVAMKQGATYSGDMCCHMYVVDPNNNERGVFYQYDTGPRNVYRAAYLDPLADRGTVWHAGMWAWDNDGIPSTDGFPIVIWITAPVSGTYKFRIGPAHGASGTSTSFVATGGRSVWIKHAGLRKGFHTPRFIPTGGGAVSNVPASGMIDNPGYIMDYSVKPYDGQHFTLVINPSWIRYPAARIVQDLTASESFNSVIEKTDNNFKVTGNWLGDDALCVVTADKFVSPSLNGAYGKYYFEAQVTQVIHGSNTYGQCVAVVAPAFGWPNAGQYFNPGYWYDRYQDDGAAWTTNDVVGVAIDYENLQVKFYRNNVLRKTVSIPNVPLAAAVQSPWTYMGQTGIWTVRMRPPFTYTPPTGFVEYDITGDPSFTFGSSNINIGGGAEIVIDGEPPAYRTLTSGTGIDVTQTDYTIRISQDIPDFALMGAGNTAKTADTIPIYDQSATTHKRVTPQELFGVMSVDDLADVNTSGAANGNALVFNGTTWVPGAGGSPTTTLGDLIRRGASADERLAIGSTGQVLTVVSGQPAWAAPTGGGGGSTYAPTDDGAYVTLTTDVSNTGSGFRLIPFANEVRDDNGYWSAANPGRFTIPNSGWYLINLYVHWDTNNSARGLWIAKNGSPSTGTNVLSGTYQANQSGMRQETSALAYLAAGEYVELYAWSDNTVSIIGSTGSPAHASIHRLGVSSSPSNPVNDGVRVRRTTNQSISTSVQTAISFDAEIRDDGAYWAAGSPTRLTVARSGWYLINGGVEWDAGATQSRYLLIVKNGSSVLGIESRTAGTGDNKQNISTLAYLTAGDYVTLDVIHSQGTSLNILSQNDGPYFALHRIGTNQLPSGGTTGQALVKASGTDGDVTWGAAVGGGGGGTVLTPDVDEDLLSSIANWTQVSGSWSAGGSYTEVTPGSGGQSRLKYNNKVAQVDITVEVEFYHRSDAPTYGDDDAGMGIKLAWDGAGNGDIYVGVSFSNNVPQDIRVEQEGISLLKTWSPGALATNTWHKLKVQSSGGFLSVFLDDVVVGSYATSVYDATSPDYVGLRAYQGNPRFRNFKVWYGGNVGWVVGSNVTHVDAPPAVPDSMDDEFEGTTLDSKWAWRNQGSAAVSVAQGRLTIGVPSETTPQPRGVYQTLPEGNWKFRAKMAYLTRGSNNDGYGIVLLENSTNKNLQFVRAYNSGRKWQVQYYTSYTAYGSTPYEFDLSSLDWAWQQDSYFEVEYDGTNYYFRVSPDGINFATVATLAKASYFTADRIGIAGIQISPSTGTGYLSCDWFRKIGTSYAPGKFAVNAQLEPSRVNVTPDDHPAIPDAIDDEFEGASLDSKWSFHAGDSTGLTFSKGCMYTGVAKNARIEQAVTGNFRVAAKMWLGKWFTANNQCFTLYARRSANDRWYDWGPWRDGASSNAWIVNYWSGTSWSGTAGTSTMTDAWMYALQPWYIEIEYDGTNLKFKRSLSGHPDGFHQEYSVAVATWLGGAPDRVGIMMANTPGGLIDWFRRLA